MSFDEAFKETMVIEGEGYAIVDGHPTYRGIDRSYWPTWEGWKLIDDWIVGNMGEKAMLAIITPLVKTFYKVNFWDRFRGDYICEVSSKVANELFDTAVNCGVTDAVRFFQTALNMQNNDAKTYPDIDVDGRMGNGTLTVFKRYLSYMPNKDNEQILINCMNGEQYLYYKKNPKHERFRGWFRRV